MNNQSKRKRISLCRYLENEQLEKYMQAVRERYTFCPKCDDAGIQELPCGICKQTGWHHVNYESLGKCSQCRGSGFVETICQYCGGYGSIKVEDFYDLGLDLVATVNDNVHNMNAIWREKQ